MLVLDQRDGPPSGARLARVQQWEQTAAVHRIVRSGVGDRDERWIEVDVFRDLGDQFAGGHAGTGDDQGNADVGLERGLLAMGQSVLARSVTADM